jgi:class 3 adenylate cyclase
MQPPEFTPSQFTPTRTKPIFDAVHNAVVLFIDMQDFTYITRDFADKDVLYAMHFCFAAFEDIINAHEGKMIKNNADECIVFFATPAPTHIWPCIEALFRCFFAIAHYYNVCGNLRFGAHCGDVLCGYIGNLPRYFDIWGRAVSLSSRLENAAQQNCVLMSDTFYQRFAPQQHLAVEPLKLKGYGSVKTVSMNCEHLRHH